MNRSQLQPLQPEATALILQLFFLLITQKLKWADEQEILFPLQVYICGEDNILFLFYFFL